MSQEDDTPRDQTDRTEEGEQRTKTELSMDQLQTMITSSIQAALPNLEDAIAGKVTESLQARGKQLPVLLLSSHNAS